MHRSTSTARTWTAVLLATVTAVACLGAVGPADAGALPKVAVTAPTQVTTGTTFGLTATVAPARAAGGTVVLEQSAGGFWVRRGTTRTAAGGKATIRVAHAAAGTFSYRFRVPLRGGSTVVTSRTFQVKAVAPPVPVLSISAPAQVLSEAPATVGVSVTGATVSGETVYLEQLSGSSWVPKATARLAPNGAAALSVTQSLAATYSYRVRIAATAKHGAATSRTVSVKVLPTTPVIAVSAPPKNLTDLTSKVTATITRSAVIGETVFLEQAVGTQWVTKATAAVGADSRAVLGVVQASAGTYTYRVRIAATGRHNAATSGTTSITVIKPDCGGATPVKADGTPWSCTYNDEFNGTALDRQFWLPQETASSNFVTGSATQPACVIDDPSVIAVRNGTLELSAKVLDTPLDCGVATSRLVSGSVSHYRTFSQTYGKFEVRAKLPAWQTNGLQETFWLWPDDVTKYGTSYPMSGEIDFAEFYSNYPNLNVPVMHYPLDPATIDFETQTNLYTSFSCVIRPGEYNTYGLEWTPGQMRILVNGEVCLVNNYAAANATAPNPFAPFDSPFFMALTQGFGTTGNEFDIATGPSLSTTSVDYVRIWK